MKPPPKPVAPLVGLSVSPPEGATGTQAFLDTFRLARGAGVRFLFLSHTWGGDLEKAPGVLDLKPLADEVQNLPLLGFDAFSVTIQTLDTTNRTLPPDLQTRAWDDPVLLARWDVFVDALAGILAAIPGRVGWLSLGNEADVYLGGHREELEAYARFIERGRIRLRARFPALPVGVTTTHDGLRDRPDLFRRLNRATDVVFLTYYPLGPNFGVRPVSGVPADFARMVRAAGNKPLLLQEAGFPADPLLNSSEEKQAAFVDAVFDQTAKYRAKIGFVNFFLLHDFGRALVDGFVGYYGLPNNARFRAFLATLGLRRANGTPRRTWGRFAARTRAWNANEK